MLLCFKLRILEFVDRISYLVVYLDSILCVKDVFLFLFVEDVFVFYLLEMDDVWDVIVDVVVELYDLLFEFMVLFYKKMGVRFVF